jgi:hypothetical protein
MAKNSGGLEQIRENSSRFFCSAGNGPLQQWRVRIANLGWVRKAKKRDPRGPVVVASGLVRRSITAIVVMMVMMVVMPMPGHHDDPWHIAAIRVMMVMMVMMVMVLRQLHIPVGGFSLWLFIDRLQERCRVRDRFE